ncbi:suppressor of fused domain protein [Pseudarthrobacter sp. LT1]|uniref:suppressor of fused domain protein n=1 Tax=Pseudarthrobacter sp. LT1 TaxID=3111450 RepID=UPI002D77AAE2|nr:suppressor of fused domain protein [Pseudarthrobacter sp. LT1]WRT12518.1 suppressor of fused domain protein [Pseudarthrobacter sp. LT1]
MIDELREHYTQAIGTEPVLHEMNTRTGKRMGVFEWPAGTTRLGVHLYTSAGAGHYWKDGHRHAVELFAGVNHGGQEVLEAFCTMALNVRESGTVPQHGVFVAGDWKIIKGRKFTGWVLTERPDNFMPQMDLPGGHVVFLDALPVFPEEAEYRHGNRSDDLFDIWEAEEVKSWDLDRGLPAEIEPRSTGIVGWLARSLGGQK